MNHNSLKGLFAAGAVLTAGSAWAILPGLTTSQYPWVAKIQVEGAGNPLGTCTAIGDHWIVTAKHVAGGQTAVRIIFDNGMEFVSDAIYAHPTDDLAIVHFPNVLPGWNEVQWVAPVVGQLMDIVGYGWSGTWNGSQWAYEMTYGTKRVGRNRFTQLMEGNFGGGIVGSFLVADFDGNGVDWFVDGGPITNEGTLGGFDSGGAAFIDGKLAGVHIFVGSAGGPNAPQYGSIFGSQRLSGYRTWIESNMPREIRPTMLHHNRGVLVSGDMASLLASDDNRLVYRPGATFTTQQKPVEWDVMATSPTLNTTSLTFSIESRASSASVQQTVQLYNYDTLQFETMTPSQATIGDSVKEYTITSNAGRFIHSNGEVWARISAKSNGPVVSYPWSFSVDRTSWHIKMP